MFTDIYSTSAEELLKAGRASWPVIAVTDKHGKTRHVRVNPERVTSIQQTVKTILNKKASTSDSDITDRLVNKDVKAQAEMYTKYKADMFRVINSFVKDKETAEDLTADTFVKAFTKIDAYAQNKDSLPFKNWLTTIASNTARDYLRSSHNAMNKNAVSEEEFNSNLNSMASTSSPSKGLEERQANEMVDKAISKLPQVYQEAIHDFYFKGKSIKEIAEATKVSESGIKQRLQRSKEILREHLPADLFKAKFPSEKEEEFLQ